jgi:hypothetical protein
VFNIVVFSGRFCCPPNTNPDAEVGQAAPKEAPKVDGLLSLNLVSPKIQLAALCGSRVEAKPFEEAVRVVEEAPTRLSEKTAMERWSQFLFLQLQYKGKDSLEPVVGVLPKTRGGPCPNNVYAVFRQRD